MTSSLGEDRVVMDTRVGSVSLRSPVMTASGTSGHGAELSAFFDLSSIGAVVVKSVSADAWAGNPAPRLYPLPGDSGMLNSVGLQNGGVDAWLSTDLPQLASTGAAVVVSIWGFTVEAYRRAAQHIATSLGRGDPGTDAIVAVEANISCPNVEDRRAMFAHSETGVADAVAAAADGLRSAVPLWAKLSPNVTDLASLAGVAFANGAESVTLINTVMGMAIDPASGLFRLGAGGGGMSGPGIHPIAVRAVFEVRSAYPTKAIVGVGGVNSGADAAELLAAGADAVQVGTATFADPRAPARVQAELVEWCRRHDIVKIEELKGRAHDRH